MSQRSLWVSIPLLVAAAGACATRGQSAPVAEGAPQAEAAQRAKCAPLDTIYRLETPVYRDCDVDKEAKPVAPTRFEFRPSSGSTANCFRAIIEFVVDETGHPLSATARVVRATDQQFAQAVILAIPGWRYAPASRGGMPVKQLVRADQSVMGVVRVSGQPAPRMPSRPSC